MVMEVCSFNSRGCMSFSEALNQYDHPTLAEDECSRLASYNSTESHWWAREKLHDLDNQRRIAAICRELGGLATSTCAVHSNRDDIYITPRTLQIYRRIQPSTALETCINRQPKASDTLVLDSIEAELRQMIDAETSSSTTAAHQERVKVIQAA